MRVLAEKCFYNDLDLDRSIGIAVAYPFADNNLLTSDNAPFSISRPETLPGASAASSSLVGRFKKVIGSFSLPLVNAA